MKRALKSILTAFLTGLMLFAVACNGNAGTTAVTLKTPGELEENAGAFAVTQGYVYFINGMAAYDGDNTYGKPVKGSVWVMDRADTTKQELVVPKLVSAEDVDAGLYFFNDCVYYGTTSIEKDTKGEINKEIIEFQQAPVNGNGVKRLLLLEGMDTEFRFAQSDSGEVYLVYYDSENKSIVSYNVESGVSTTVATDVASYLFTDSKDAVVVYTKDVKTFPNDEDSTALENYNELYAYCAGDTSFDKRATGKPAKGVGAIKFTLDKTVGDLLIVKEKAANNDVESSYVVPLGVLHSGDYDGRQKIVNDVTTGFVKNEGTVYTVTEGLFEKASLLSESTTVLALDEDAATILSVVDVDGDDYAVYLDTNSAVKAIRLDETTPSEKPYVLYGNTVNTSWYTPTVASGYLVVCDASDFGQNYLRLIDLNQSDFFADANFDEVENGDKTTYVLKDAFVVKLGKTTDADEAKVVEAYINDVKSNGYDKNQRLNVRDDVGELTMEDGKIVSTLFEKAKAAYEALSADGKAALSSTAKAAYDKYAAALELDNAFYKLNGFIDDNGTWAVHTEDEWRARAEEVKAVVEETMKKSDFEDYFNLCDQNLLREYWGNSEIVDGAQDVFFKD